MNLSSSDVWAIFWISLFSWMSIMAISDAASAKYSNGRDDNEEE